ncbi:tpr domain protein [Colletotrichum sojae]|uniref:Tpr domain protein n=1 Tax=Colletotrichum sojae TaxID=2175907 RepID=A0A8H6IV89_9PEZI|nr:tpr domain protein [Colletotrichum sojae]
MDVKEVSDDSELASFFRQVKAAGQLSGRRKGETPRDHPPPFLVVARFNMGRSAAISEQQLRRREVNTQFVTSQIPPAYLPCVESVASLQPLAISEMKLEEHHKGKRVTVRTMTQTSRINAIMAIAEDEEGTAVLLQLYNQPDEAEVKAEYVLPENSVCIIKEPFFKVTTSGEYSLRVDHVTDIIMLPEDDERIPLKWRSTQGRILVSSEETRLEGNEAVSRQDWGQAERLYTQALSSAASMREHSAALLNRSLANLRLRRPEKALDDALRARQGGNTTEKGLFREAKAHYAMDQFSSCKYKLQQVLQLNPENKDTKIEMARVDERLREEATGEYAWRQMYEQAEATPPLVDCATYSVPIEVRPSPGRGNGLFTTKAVKAGDLLLCEKAFAYCYAAEDDPVGRRNIKILMSVDSNRASMGGQANLITTIVQRLHHNPQISKRFTGLHHGDYQPAEPDKTGESLVDSFLVERTVRLNCFGAPRTSLKAHVNDRHAAAVHTTCGIWTIASHINHSCLGNCRRSFIGDMMIIRAAQDMEAGSELLFCYRPPKPGDDYQTTQKAIANWGFVCQCELCEDKKAMSKQTFQKRKGLLQDLRHVMKVRGNAVHGNANQVEAKALRLLEQLETCYPKRIGATRLELWDFYLALGQSRLENGAGSCKALELIIKALEALGYVLVATPPARVPTKPTLEIKRWGWINDHSIIAFIAMFHAYKAQSLAPELCEVAKGYARTAYAICIGEKETTGSTYDDLK